MSQFFALKNIRTQSLSPCIPWEFKPTPEEMPSAEIRSEKPARQAWYNNKNTVWQYYTAIEAANPNQRIDAGNPARTIWAFVADYDIPVPYETIQAAIARMKHKPQWIETSLGGKTRLVWILPRPIPVNTNEFCVCVLQRAVKFLDVNQLVGLDGPAFESPTRLYCNGGVWRATGEPMISEAEIVKFYVDCGQAYTFKPAGTSKVDLKEVEKAIIAKYPGFSWPGPFDYETQGPSFWIPQSVSPMSAIVKEHGMFTFSANADKPFYPWTEIVGPDFIRQYEAESIKKATDDTYFDRKHFWRFKNGIWVACEMTEMQNHLKVDCNISNKADKTGISPLDRVFSHIYNFKCIAGAAPFVFRQPGLIEFQGKRVLNTYVNTVIKPANCEPPAWGDDCIKFICSILDNFFDPPDQLPFFLAWWKYLYESALNLTPLPGQNIYLMGIAGVGKTLMSRNCVGASVGGFVDASRFMTKETQFNSEMYEVGLWCIDDETIGQTIRDQDALQAMMKKISANTEMMYNKKYEVSVMTAWNGRAIVTTNLDYVSTRILGSMDNTSGDKTNIFRCSSSGYQFPKRLETAARIEQELPYFLRWLTTWEPPEHVTRDSRFGYKSYHEPTLLRQAYQSSKIAPVKELLIEFLREFFRTHPDDKYWRGTTTQLVRDIFGNPQNDAVVRLLRIDQVPRYLEMIQREGMMDCTTETGEANSRYWVFHRFGEPATRPAENIPQSENSNFAI